MKYSGQRSSFRVRSGFGRQAVGSRARRSAQGGYILLTLMLFVSLLAIAAVAIAPTLTFQIKRDREDEMVHRGVQYSRAVRKYFKKFGRYPTRLEDLENTNNLRFLRKRYKDPITGADFKLLHFSDVQMSMGGGGGMPGAGGMPPGAATGANGATANTAQGFSLGPTATPAAASQPAAQPGDPEPDGSADSTSPKGQGAGGASNASGSPVVGGGPIVGVTSSSKAQSIREFNNKNHYNQWQFIYDPGTDTNRGGLINTPAQPPLQNAIVGQPGAMPGAPGAAGAGASPFGAGMGNGMSNGSMGGPAAPAQNPPPPHPQPPMQ